LFYKEDKINVSEYVSNKIFSKSFKTEYHKDLS